MIALLRREESLVEERPRVPQELRGPRRIEELSIVGPERFGAVGEIRAEDEQDEKGVEYEMT